MIAVQVKEELVAPAYCSAVGLGREGNEDRDTLTYRGAEGLPKGKVPTDQLSAWCRLPRPDFAKKPQGDPA